MKWSELVLLLVVLMRLSWIDIHVLNGRATPRLMFATDEWLESWDQDFLLGFNYASPLTRGLVTAK